jgi:hypothetical protein
VFVLFLALGADVVPFPDLQKPASLKIHKDRIFINDGAVIYIHSLKDFKQVNRFGGEGEGPQEFKIHPNINKGGVVFHVQENHIIVSSLGRVSYFTRDGRYIKEMNPNTLFGFGSFVPFGKSFVAMGIAGDAQKQYYTFNFYNDAFQKGKEIFKVLAFDPAAINPVTIRLFPEVHTCDNKIFINDLTGTIHVFDSEGKETAAINIDGLKEYKGKLKVTDDHKNKYIKFFETDYRFKNRFAATRHLMKFPGYFPIMRNFTIDNNKIYAFTFREAQNKRELFILDLEGNLLKKTWIALEELNPHEFYPYTIKDGKVYQLRESAESEGYELHITGIKE